MKDVADVIFLQGYYASVVDERRKVWGNVIVALSVTAEMDFCRGISSVAVVVKGSRRQARFHVRNVKCRRLHSTRVDDQK